MFSVAQGVDSRSRMWTEGSCGAVCFVAGLSLYPGLLRCTDCYDAVGEVSWLYSFIFAHCRACSSEEAQCDIPDKSVKI